MSVLLVPRVTLAHVLTHREPSHVIVLVPALRETRVRMVISITYFIHDKLCNILRLAYSLRNSRMNKSLLTLTFTCKAVRFFFTFGIHKDINFELMKFCTDLNS